MHTGLVFGKFYPFHIGHENLIDFAQMRCDKLIILVCASDREFIDLRVRTAWMENMYRDNPKVIIQGLYYSEDELPNTSESSRLISKIWSNRFLQMFKKIDVIFSAEDYGDYVAEYMGATHQRYYFPKTISATLIRNNLDHYWSFLNSYSRKSFIKKVVLLGTESTGKSTLAKLLAHKFNGELVTEAGRDLVENSRTCSYDDLQAILVAHAEQIKQKMHLQPRLVVIDTDMHITQSYSRFLFKKNLDIPNEVAQLNQADLYLYLNKDSDYVQDGTRLTKRERDLLDNSHREVLSDNQIPYLELKGSYNQKNLKAIDYVAQLLRLSFQNLEAPLVANMTR